MRSGGNVGHNTNKAPTQQPTRTRKRQTRTTITSTYKTHYKEGGRLGLICRQGYKTDEDGDNIQEGKVEPREGG